MFGWIINALGISSILGIELPFGWIGLGGTLAFAGFMSWIVAEVKLKPKPNLQIFDIPEPDKRPIRDVGGQGVTFGVPIFAYVKFCNRPKKRSEEANAKKVFNRIVFYDMGGNIKVEPERIRFGGTPEPPYQNKSQPRQQYYEIEFNANGSERELTIAMKYEDEDICYAYSDMSYEFTQWKKPQYELDGDDFYVRVDLSGENTEGMWWFILHNYGKGKRLQLETTAAPSFDK